VNRESDSASHWEYVDFDLEIGEQGGPRRYPVSARSADGEAKEEMRFPFDEWQLKDILRDVEVALLRSGGSRRRIGTPEDQTIQGFGRALFEALLVGEVGAHYRVSLREARRQNKGLRVKLHVRPPELSALPWEFIYDPKRDYLCLSSRTPLVRYPDVPHPIERLIVTPPLRILGMVASPQGLPRLDVGHEKRLVEEAVRALQMKNLVELTWLEGQTWRDLQRAMRHGPWHVFHFIGHGGFDPETEEGAIALSDEEDRTYLLGATDLALLLDDHYFLRLVFLNSCEGAKGSPRDPFASTAASLVRYGMPAVVAMQYEITDKAAIEFSRAFYDAIADGLPVDAAVAEARTAIKMKSTLEWGTPVLYMRSSDGSIFDVPTEASLVRPPQEEGGDREGGDALRRYREAVESAWAHGELSKHGAAQLRELASQLRLNANTAADTEREVMGDTIEATLRHQERIAEEERRRDRLEQLYARAHRAHRDRGWQTVVDLFEQLHAEDPAYPDPEGLLASAHEAQEVKELRRRVAVLYDRGLRHMEARQWPQALRCFEEVQRLESGYQETEELLSRVRLELARPPKVKVPDLSGQEISQASSTLANKGLELSTQNVTPDDRMPEGKIIKQSPEVGTEVEEGSLVGITVSSGPQMVIVTSPSGGRAGGRHWWALAFRGLVLVIFGLLIAFFRDVDSALELFGAAAMIYGVLLMTNGLLAIIDTPRGVGRRHLLWVESRISVFVGLATLLVGLVAFVLNSAIEFSYPPTGDIVFYLVGFWAICIGATRTVAAIRLGQEFKIVRLMIISGALLVVSGIFLLLGHPWDQRLLLGFWPLASGILLLAFAFQVRGRERSGH
jgi:uncharacterized membrane protein HdeD (DUF308 family)